jgi:hypothetical protein
VFWRRTTLAATLRKINRIRSISSFGEGQGIFDECHMPLCRSGELGDLWNSVGLIDVQEHPLDIEMRFTSFEDYWRPFLAGQGPAGAYTVSLDFSDLQRLRQELIRRMSISEEDVSFVLPARAWAVRGTVPQ